MEESNVPFRKVQCCTCVKWQSTYKSKKFIIRGVPVNALEKFDSEKNRCIRCINVDGVDCLIVGKPVIFILRTTLDGMEHDLQFSVNKNGSLIVERKLNGNGTAKEVSANSSQEEDEWHVMKTSRGSQYPQQLRV